MKSFWVLIIGVALMSTPSSGWAETAKADIQPTQSNTAGFPVSGTATLIDTPDGLKVTVQVTHVLPGQHGVHIHQYGDCSDGGNAAGGHYNPDKVTHGFLPKDGLTKAHPGDLGNIEVAPDGTGALTIILPGVSLTGDKYHVAGRAIVLHEKVDDFGQPTGNAGARIGCGTILLTKE